MINHFTTLASTLDTAKELARAGAPNGTVVIADEQTGGRGQHGRVFQSPLGGLYLSLILRPELPPHQLTDLTVMTAVAVCSAISKVCPELQPRIKPVNDVRLGYHKVCGILVELSSTGNHTDFAVVGIGINVAPVTFANVGQQTTSLETAAGRLVDLLALRDALLVELAALEDALPHHPDWLQAYQHLLEVPIKE